MKINEIKQKNNRNNKHQSRLTITKRGKIEVTEIQKESEEITFDSIKKKKY